MSFPLFFTFVCFAFVMGVIVGIALSAEAHDARRARGADD